MTQRTRDSEKKDHQNIHRLSKKGGKYDFSLWAIFPDFCGIDEIVLILWIKSIHNVWIKIIVRCNVCTHIHSHSYPIKWNGNGFMRNAFRIFVAWTTPNNFLTSVYGTWLSNQTHQQEQIEQLKQKNDRKKEREREKICYSR